MILIIFTKFIWKLFRLKIVQDSLMTMRMKLEGMKFVRSPQEKARAR